MARAGGLWKARGDWRTFRGKASGCQGQQRDTCVMSHPGAGVLAPASSCVSDRVTASLREEGLFNEKVPDTLSPEDLLGKCPSLHSVKGATGDLLSSQFLIFSYFHSVGENFMK